MNSLRLPATAFAAVMLSALVAQSVVAQGTVLFSDSFNRPDSPNVDSSVMGIGGITGSTLMVDGVYNEPYVTTQGREISGGQLRLAVGPEDISIPGTVDPTSSNVVLNHNFINPEILAGGGFSVSVDVAAYTPGTNGTFGGGFGIGMSAAEAAIVGDIRLGTPNNAKVINSLGTVRGATVSDFYIGIRNDNLLVWGTGAANGQGLSFANVGATTGNIRVDFGFSSFTAGDTVSYRIYFNDTLIEQNTGGDAYTNPGSFTWTDNDSNFIGLDGRSPTFVAFDNLEITTLVLPTLTVDRSTGEIFLTNNTNQSIELAAYDINSAVGALDQSEWATIESQRGVSDSEWFTFTAPGDNTNLAEGTIGGYTLASMASISLGDVWVRSPFEDVEIELRDTDGNDVPVVVKYIGDEILLGDFDLINGVDSADWPTLRDNLRTDVSSLSPLQAYGAGDLNLDGMVDRLDYRLFKADFLASLPGEALPQTGAVPEPTSLCLGIGLLGLIALRRRVFRAYVRGLVVLGAMVLPGLAVGADLFTDSFDRADEVNIDLTKDGMSGPVAALLAADAVYLEPHTTGGTRDILSNQLRLAVGPGTANIVIDHNFTDASILSDGGFRVSVDVVDYPTESVPHGGAIGIGMSRAEALSTGDADAGFPNGAKISNAFQSGISNFNAAISDFWFGIRGNGTVAWGAGTVAPGDSGYVTSAVGSPTGTISATFAPVGFNQGDNVGYEVFYNGVSQGFGSFQWSQDMQNYIGLDAKDPQFVQFDNFSITTATDAVYKPLRLLVDTDTGVVSIAGGDVANTLDYYEILSDGNGLVEGSFTGLAGAPGFPAGTGIGNGWEAIPENGSDALVETYLAGSSMVGIGAAPISLGAIYNVGLDTRDLQFYYQTQGGPVVPVAVEYLSSGSTVPDFNGDGFVDAADYTVWRDNLGLLTGATLLDGDADGDGDVDATDYNLWKQGFGTLAASAVIAGQVPEPGAVTAGSVPEPGTAIISLLAALMCVALGSRTVGTRSGSKT